MDNLNKKNDIIKIYIDRWCANVVRKVSSCEKCLHYKECKEQGESLAPRAIEHRLNKERRNDEN